MSSQSKEQSAFRGSQNSADGNEEKNDKDKNDQFFFGPSAPGFPALRGIPSGQQPNDLSAQITPPNPALEKRRQLLSALLQRLGAPVTQLTQSTLDTILSKLMTPSYANEGYGPSSKELQWIKDAQLFGDARYNASMIALLEKYKPEGCSAQGSHALKDFCKTNNGFQGWVGNQLGLRQIFLLARDEANKNGKDLPQGLASSCLEILVYFVWVYALPYEKEGERLEALQNIIDNMLGQPFKEACAMLDGDWQATKAKQFLTNVMTSKK